MSSQLPNCSFGGLTYGGYRVSLRARGGGGHDDWGFYAHNYNHYITLSMASNIYKDDVSQVFGDSISMRAFIKALL